MTHLATKRRRRDIPRQNLACELIAEQIKLLELAESSQLLRDGTCRVQENSRIVSLAVVSRAEYRPKMIQTNAHINVSVPRVGATTAVVVPLSRTILPILLALSEDLHTITTTKRHRACEADEA